MHQRFPIGAAVVAAIALATAGCGGSDEASPGTETSPSTKESTVSMATPPPSDTSTAAGPGDYSSLLIKPSDIGPNVTTDKPPTPNPYGQPGTGQIFDVHDGPLVIVTITVYPDDAAAQQMIEPVKKTLAEKIDAEPSPVDIGSGTGVMIQGKDKTKPIESSEVIFTQGRAVIDLEIDSDAGKPTSSDELLDLARKQAALVAQGLSG